jgi:hypothetical protein
MPIWSWLVVLFFFEEKLKGFGDAVVYHGADYAYLNGEKMVAPNLPLTI